MARIEVTWQHNGFQLQATDAENHVVTMDSSVAHGGTQYGVRPMQMLLIALGGCSGIDVLDILKKQRQEVQEYKTIIEGERESGKEPSLWKTIQIEFYIQGIVEPAKAQRAVELSMNKYCSVAATLRKAGANITWKIFVNGNNIAS